MDRGTVKMLIYLLKQWFKHEGKNVRAKTGQKSSKYTTLFPPASGWFIFRGKGLKGGGGGSPSLAFVSLKKKPQNLYKYTRNKFTPTRE